MQCQHVKRISETDKRPFSDCRYPETFGLWFDQPSEIYDDLKRYVRGILDSKLKQMRNEVDSLKDVIQKLRRSTLVQDILVEEWDNEYDKWWNTV